MGMASLPVQPFFNLKLAGSNEIRITHQSTKQENIFLAKPYDYRLFIFVPCIKLNKSQKLFSWAHFGCKILCSRGLTSTGFERTFYRSRISNAHIFGCL